MGIKPVFFFPPASSEMKAFLQDWISCCIYTRCVSVVAKLVQLNKHLLIVDVCLCAFLFLLKSSHATFTQNEGLVK